MTVKRRRPAGPAVPQDSEPSDPELAALWASPAFRAAIEAGRAGLAEGAISLDEVERELGLTDEQKAAAAAWLDAYERELDQAAAATSDPGARPAGNGTTPPAKPKPKRARKP